MVSIIVTTYNYAHFLVETLSSVRNQTFMDWECIVVDSGSTDNTSEVIDRFVGDDRRFKYLKVANHGVSASRNAGILIGKGEYLQFLDGDDLLQENKISSQMQAFEEIPYADLVYGNVKFFDDKNPKQLRSSLHGNKPDNWLPHLSGKGPEVLKHLRSINFLVTHSPLIRRHVADKNGGFDERMPALEDWDFWLRAAIEDNYFHYHAGLNDLVLVRVHSSSLSRKKQLMLDGNFILYSKLVFNGKTGYANSVFFIIKHIELFWNTIFSDMKLPSVSMPLFVISVLMFPAWMIIRLLRIIKLI